MNQITIISILQKIRSVCKECRLQIIPERAVSGSHINFQAYFKALEEVRLEFIKLKNLQEEYSKLEEFLQKQQTQIRKRIGVEQQFKLYTQTLKTQVEELEGEKADLLENTKAYIKQLKKTNQSLFAELHSRAMQKTKIKHKSHDSSPNRAEKSKHNKSISHHKPKHDKSIKEIIKTQYIDRERSSSAKPHRSKKKHKFGVYSTISGHDGDYKDNSKTFQVVYSSKKQKQRPTATKRKNQHGLSNFTLFNFLDSSNRKLKKDKHGSMISRSPLKVGSKKKQTGKNRNQANSKSWKQKKANKSIFSVISVQPNYLHNKKETI